MNRQGIIKCFLGISVTLGLVLMVCAVYFRLTALPDLAKILPQDGTEAFFMVQTAGTGSVFQTNSYANLAWVDAVGWAKVENSKLDFVEVNSSQEAAAYLQSLKSEGEQLTQKNATRSLWSTVTCYPASANPCFTWMGDLLIFSDDENLLETVQKVAAGQIVSLKNSANYQNVRSRLASWTGGFVYLDLEKILPHYAEDFKTFEPLLQLYPAFGASARHEENAWSVESFLGVDKALIGSEAYWHSEEKYEANFLPWTNENFAVEWGGMNAGGQIQQVMNLLQKRSPEAAALFNAELLSSSQSLFGTDLDFNKDLLPLLDGEQYFGFTPSSDFLFLTQLDSDSEIQSALHIKDLFASHYLFPKKFTAENGEIQARFTPLTESTGQYKNYQYYTFSVGDEEVATVLLTEKVAIVSGKSQTAFDTFDRMQGRIAQRNLDSFDSLLSGSNEVFTVHCLLLPDGSILKTLLGGFDTITTARKLFDDGSFARSVVQLSTPHD